MKVLIGEFVTESNANVPDLCQITDYDIAFGEECINKMQVKHVFKHERIEIIPSIYANAGASGVVEANTFKYIEECFKKSVSEHLGEIDGIYLMLHGASEVEGLGSGDHHLLKEIRKIVGPYLPIAVSCDPHGNLCNEYTDNLQVIRSYRQSPHTDKEETYEKVSKILCKILKDRINITACYQKLPLILGGEQSVSSDEPVRSINDYMDEMEKDPRILSVSWHVGYIRHDCPEAGCGVVVIPASEEDQEYADNKCKELATYVWNKRHEFHYTGLTAKPNEALDMVLKFEGSPCVITDSGDNTTSGATGWNTYILRQVLETKDLKKSFLFATINDSISYDQLRTLNIDACHQINLGVNRDELSKSISLNVRIKSFGDICRFKDNQVDKIFGSMILVNIIDTNIDIMIANTRQPIIDNNQLQHLNIDWVMYDVIVLKQGYIFPEFKEKSKFYVMSLTMGATPQDTSSIQFKRIMRPMFPVDNI
ncbi:M81 family metallopeptidase [Anaerorhabdus sp.]|uniref:M81 family metallopeptidase n=1 Tax=Anaerorhabdus sp. TaxID=1872524 RepID=UPI002FC78BD8